LGCSSETAVYVGADGCEGIGELADALVDAGLLLPAEPVSALICDGCERNCVMPVNIVPATVAEPSRAFIVCDKRDDIGRVPVDPTRLRRWMFSLLTLADALASTPKKDDIAVTPEPDPTSAPWLPLHNAVAETATTAGRPIAWSRRAIQTAIQTGLLTIRGVPVGNEGQSSDLLEPSVIAASSLEEVRAARGAKPGVDIEWNNSETPPELVMTSQGLSPARYSGLEVLRDRFEAWLLMMRGNPLKLPRRFVGMREAFARLRRHIKKTERRSAPDAEIAQIIVEHARRKRLNVWWTDETLEAASLFSGSWDEDRLPAGLKPEALILNGAIKANTLVFIRREFAQWLGDRPEEANPSPKRQCFTCRSHALGIG
jgi:hypothetical protein